MGRRAVLARGPMKRRRVARGEHRAPVRVPPELLAARYLFLHRRREVREVLLLLERVARPARGVLVLERHPLTHAVDFALQLDALRRLLVQRRQLRLRLGACGLCLLGRRRLNSSTRVFSKPISELLEFVWLWSHFLRCSLRTPSVRTL